ncbi:hypothetical protein [Alienimonas californiensis]|uniref:CRISPR-associated protein Cas6 C-terminal domain-containing protein n=1 Tax=Alienimonas californiensis TaxID=2527989 RepID=A0A517P6Q2_9PLAN|nr:hypothetical protein [Alienimonas californiensis]QDT15057.1 hypothetical protein CA12_11370 [Alienimonas californiensis]
MRVLTVDGLSLEFVSAGRLAPWLGPAVRGTLAEPLRRGRCPATAGGGRCEPGSPEACVSCATYEALAPPVPAGSPLGRARGAGGGVPKPVSLAPAGPAPDWAAPGDRLLFRLTLLGPAAAHMDALLAALDGAGRDRGLGPDAVRFSLAGIARPTTHELIPAALPGGPRAVPGTIPRLGLELTAPLFLTGRDGTPLVEPDLPGLVRSAVRTVGTLLACWGEGDGELTRADTASLIAAAESARPLPADARWGSFSQSHQSTRQGRRRTLRGCGGAGAWADVPACLLPWLLWAGRLGCGKDRVAGAGVWRLTLD